MNLCSLFSVFEEVPLAEWSDRENCLCFWFLAQAWRSLLKLWKRVRSEQLVWWRSHYTRTHLTVLLLSFFASPEYTIPFLFLWSASHSEFFCWEYLSWLSSFFIRESEPSSLHTFQWSWFARSRCSEKCLKQGQYPSHRLSWTPSGNSVDAFQQTWASCFLSLPASTLPQSCSETHLTDFIASFPPQSIFNFYQALQKRSYSCSVLNPVQLCWNQLHRL